MSSCTNCGAVLADLSAFCGKCGASQIPGVVTAADIVAPQNAKTRDGWKAAGSSAGLAPNVAAALSYAFGAVSGAIFLFVEPFRSNAFVKFHALQSIFFMVGIVRHRQTKGSATDRPRLNHRATPRLYTRAR